MRKKIFLRFFAVTLASTLVMFIFGILAVKFNAESVMKQRLIDETKMVALLIDEKNDFEKFKSYENDSKFRVTIFDISGNVVFESDTHAELENHADREEIIYALSGEPSTVKRYSETFGCQMIYYAQTVEVEGVSYVLRLAIRSSELSPYLSITTPLFIAVLLTALIASVIISHFISLNISSKIVSVGQSLKSIKRGKYVPIKADESDDELYSVLCEINELNASTLNHIRETEREKKKLGRVLESISQGIIALDSVKNIAFINRSTREIFGCDEDVVGKGIVNMVDDLTLLSILSNHVFESYSFECTYKERELSVVMRELNSDELSISSIIIITDITSERAVAKQKSEFFANASHELKTPITVMQGLSELVLSDEEINEPSKKRIERIHKESVRLSSLISDMLLLSCMESGNEIELATTKVSLRETFSEAFDELKVRMAQKEISYTLSGDGEVLADPKRIYELADNLISNAIRYNKIGGKIDVTIESTDTHTEVYVKDTGIGIEKKHIPMLCQRFFRVDKSHSKKTGGTGLGLAIVKHICLLYGATIEIESELDVGSTFIVKFKK